ncbi:MAG: serine/threonine-protein kinase [Dehalococcoidia bacterium]
MMRTPEASDSCPACGTETPSGNSACTNCGQATVAYSSAGITAHPSDAAVPAAETGQRIGRFLLQGMLGRGGFATVYRAEDSQLRRQVAIKLLHSHLTGDTTFVQRFAAEARAAARLRHPHIVTIYEVGSTVEGRPYLVMELLRGTLLSALITEHAPLAFEQAAAIVSQLASALDYLHQEGIIHRDLKPSNVMLDQAGSVTLMDFGVARAVDAEARLTNIGQIVGTPVYMAPEQFGDDPVGPSADIYALGVLTYEIFAGRPPFMGSTAAIMRAHLDAPPPPIVRFNPEAPPFAVQAIEQTLAKDPAARPRTAVDFSALLQGQSSRKTQTAAAPEDQHHEFGAPAHPARDGTTLSAAPIQTRRWAGIALPSRRILACLVAALTGGGATLVWLFLAGPLARGDGYLRINSDPPGATVRIDDRDAGITPLKSLKLPPGTHDVVMQELTYGTLQTQLKVRSRQTKTLTSKLVSLPGSQLVKVDRVGATRDSTVSPSGSTINLGPTVSQVQPEQPYSIFVELAQAYPGQRDVKIQTQFILLDSSGVRVAEPVPVSVTIAKDDTSKVVGWNFTFHSGALGNGTVRPYQIKFFVDGTEIASRLVAVTP